ncbi:WD repeat-containing protein 46-like [Tetranychus urticae]|uniref:WD repeat-containing protein 46-like n=1 Tax=Tetranychus urticae TaxID=32264 RepID=UPI00077BC173|nr:WD repeat-containing protein 46-like [Tetranychus urticae]
MKNRSSKSIRRKDAFIKKTKERRKVELEDEIDLLLPGTGGFIEPDENEKTYQINQKEIVSSVDITSATKCFELKLIHGPYVIDYFRNGRQVLTGGEKGHVAAMDWVTKKLICEFNVMESVHAIKWLHMPNIFACAQRDWVHIYDDKGTEIHCLKKLYKVNQMEFLPHHFLLVTASDQGFLSWTDTSYGKLIAQFRPKKVRKIMSMAQNYTNGVILTGHSNGVVNMWTPNSQDPAIQMLCHSGSLTDIGITSDGTRMVSLGTDRKMKLWDIRMLKPLKSYSLKSIGSCIDVSQRDLIGVSTGNIVQIFKDSWNTELKEPYLRSKSNGLIKSIKFCNFEDVLGIGHENGFSSILVPGAGEPNFDALESNPFMTTSQRREMEVKMLLSKIPSELINVDPEILGKVNIKQLKETIASKKKLGYVKVPKIQFKEKKSMKSVKKFKLKKQLRDEAQRNHIKGMRNENIGAKANSIKKRPTNRSTSSRTSSKGLKVVNKFFVQKGLKKAKKSKPKEINIDFSNVLDRFKPKTK